MTRKRRSGDVIETPNNAKRDFRRIIELSLSPSFDESSVDKLAQLLTD